MKEYRSTKAKKIEFSSLVLVGPHWIIFVPLDCTKKQEHKGSSNWFQKSLFAALQREPEKVQVALGSLACSPEGGYLPGPAQVI